MTSWIASNVCFVRLRLSNFLLAFFTDFASICAFGGFTWWCIVWVVYWLSALIEISLWLVGMTYHWFTFFFNVNLRRCLSFIILLSYIFFLLFFLAFLMLWYLWIFFFRLRIWKLLGPMELFTSDLIPRLLGILKNFLYSFSFSLTSFFRKFFWCL